MQYWLAGMRKKMGLQTQEENDLKLANDLLASMDGQQVDYTLLFRSLAKVLQGEDALVHELFADASAFIAWTAQWKERLERDELSTSESIELMNQVNPIYIPRNHKVEEALDAAVYREDYSKFEMLIETLSQPYLEEDGKEYYTQPASKEFEASFETFCGT